jgi:hypothetical protein
MKFQIEKIIIWPINRKFPPRELTFNLGKVNVITGASRTGKTAIIPIIDYCLGSGSCSIPIGVIRDNTSWYGIIINVESEKILLARKVPDGNKLSTHYYFIRGKVISIPTIIEVPNETQEGIKIILDSICCLPYVNRDNDNSGYDNRLSFRDLTHLVFQSQDIIANQSILFYKTHLTEHREKLKRWFPFILGAETSELIIARGKLRDVQLELSRKQNEYNKAKSVSQEWLQNLFGQLKVSKEYGLYNGVLTSETTQDELLIIAKAILKDKPERLKSTSETINDAQKEIHKIEDEETQLSEKIAIINKRQKDIDDLEENLAKFHNGTKRKVDRLGISDWLRMNMQTSNECPVCGEIGHPLAHKEIDKICDVLKRYEKSSSTSLELPAAFAREKEELRTQLNDLMGKLKVLRERFDVLRSQDEEVMKYQQRTKDMYVFLGQLKSTVNLIEQLSDTGDFENRIRELKKQETELKKLLSSSNMATRLDLALQQISQLTLNRLKTLDVDPKYKSLPPQFSLKELGIQVTDNEGNWHLLTEVGSASNWVSFHLAFTCALQEFFIEQKNPISMVPSFIVFDQPSQVYFPRISKTDNEDDPNYNDEDINAVKNMFITLSDSIKSTHGAWQAIVLDHAGSDIYGDIENVIEVEEWRNGEKLIPEFWYNDNN